MPVYRLEIEPRPGLGDPQGATTLARVREWEGLDPSHWSSRRLYWLDLNVDRAQAQGVLEQLCDPVAEVGALGVLPDPPAAQLALQIQFLPGVTDSVGKSIVSAARDYLGPSASGQGYSGMLYFAAGLGEQELLEAARRCLFNPLIESARVFRLDPDQPRVADLQIPRAAAQVTDAAAGLASDSAPDLATKLRVEIVALRDADDERLLQISEQGMLALSLAEMRAIAEYFKQEGRDPYDAELECFAQTWSEHCKHKIFASPIEYRAAADASPELIEEGIFSRYIRGATSKVARDRQEAGLDPKDESFLVSVFHDNAGVVRFSDTHHLAYKVETHNSPSALDPYGGSMTGIVGVNRDSYGTGRGAELLTNVWGYCLGAPEYDQELPKGLMPPKRIRQGVHAGVIDGGNHSGIPYSRGFEIFDDRYVGKPLVYCGTVSVMPKTSAGKATHEKYIAPGDRVVMVGGRIGKDGIHGATFSSIQLDENSPVQAVQIGDPLVQKMMWDFLSVARDRGLYSGLTDNGAGGLSSSVGEMAEHSNGARIDLAQAPLKYPGLLPWEILISEAQERMTVAVPPAHLPEFLALAQAMEVEASDLGEFCDSGRFEVCYGSDAVCDLDLHFLHNGVPLPQRKAQWKAPPALPTGAQERGAAFCSLHSTLLSMLGSVHFSCKEAWGRNYDHEVKGLSVIKPWIGVDQDIPSAATVMRVQHHRDEGVVLGEGIFPHYSDVDSYWMAVATVDEALRRVLCAGSRFDRVSALDNFCWPDPIESPKTPDGQYKLAQLVRACQGLYDACVGYGIPLISGKDSMKNDAILDGIKISIPPTLLVSAMGQIEDVSGALSLELFEAGLVVLLLGDSRGELSGSAWAQEQGVDFGQDIPTCDLAQQKEIYARFASLVQAHKIRGAQVTSRGGLLMAFAQMVMASSIGLEIDLRGVGNADLTPIEAAFSESLGRIVALVAPEDLAEVQQTFAGYPLQVLGKSVAGDEVELRLLWAEESLQWSRDELCRAYRGVEHER